MAKNIIKILAFDPGKTITAWALLSYNTNTGSVTIVRTGNIYGNKLLNRVKDQTVLFNSDVLTYTELRKEVGKVASLKPDYVTCEDFFYQKGLHRAYASLALCVHAIETAIKDTLGLPVVRMPARKAKQILSGGGAASKTDISDALDNVDDIYFEPTQNNIEEQDDISTNKKTEISKLSEHEADAVAVGYAFAKDTLMSIHSIGTDVINKGE